MAGCQAAYITCFIPLTGCASIQLRAEAVCVSVRYTHETHEMQGGTKWSKRNGMNFAETAWWKHSAAFRSWTDVFAQ